MENFFVFFPRYGKLFRDFSMLWKTFFHAVENPARKGSDGAPLRPACSIPLPLLSAVRKTWMNSSTAPQDSDGAPLRPACSVPLPLLSAVRRTWTQRISFEFGRGVFAEIRREFSDDGALRTTRAGLVSARGRPRRASTEKARLGFRAVQIQKKSSLPNPLLTPRSHPHPHSILPSFHSSTLPSFHPSTPTTP